MAARGALVDALGQRAHLGDARRNLLTEQHAAAAGLGALADDDLDGVGPAQVIGVHAVARGQHLVDEQLRMPALLLRHAAVAGGGGGAGERRAAPKRFFRLARQRAEAHAGDGDRNFQLERLFGKAGAELDVGCALLAIALKRVAAHGGAEEQQIIEVGQLALGAAAADVIDAGRRRALDFRDRGLVERRGTPRRGMDPAALLAHQ